ncbi:MAG TPA: hypothetical protein VME46_23820 [Acidimicrobiales bacterium]|nr:hypothetical protein [Acidimicrobiales bacterium]
MAGTATSGYLWALDVPQGPVSQALLDQAVSIITARLDGLGARRHDVYVHDGNVVVGIPQARNASQVLAVAGETARLFFRPVDCEVAPYLRSSRTGRGDQPAPATSLSSVTTTTSTSLSSYACGLSAQQQEVWSPPNGNQDGLTPVQYDATDATVVLPYYADFVNGKYQPDERFVLGPAQMSGSIVSSATATLDATTDEWEVDLSFTTTGATEFNDYASQYYTCYAEDRSDPPDAQACPPYGALQAIELDAKVYSAPAIEASSFPGGATINGSTADPFTSTQANDLADALNYGSLPVRLVTQVISSRRPY